MFSQYVEYLNPSGLVRMANAHNHICTHADDT